MTRVGSAAAGAVPVCVFVISNAPLARKSADDAPIQKSMRPASISHWPRGLQNANCSGVRLKVTRLRAPAASSMRLKPRSSSTGRAMRRDRIAHVELHHFIAGHAAGVLHGDGDVDAFARARPICVLCARSL